MKIYIDLAKQAIINTTDEKVYEGDFYSNVFEVLFYNYEDENWFPTMSQLAPNGREAGDFTADALGAGESHTYVEDGKTYLRFTFTMGATWVLMKGKSNFYIWMNRLNGTLLKKCVGMVNIMIDQSTDNYFIADVTFNPSVKAYIDSCIDEQNEVIAQLGTGAPKYFDTAANIALLEEDKGLAVATDTDYVFYWDVTEEDATKYKNSGLQYTNLSAYYTKTESDNRYAPKSTAITHTGNQLQDYSGNNVYPNIENNQIVLNNLDSALKSILVEKVNNIVRTSSNNNSALNISGVVTQVSPTYRTNVYDVSGKNIIYVNATTIYPNSSYCDYCFTDDTDTIISYYRNGTPNVSYSLDTFINVPSNAKYFKLSIVNSTFGNEQVLSVADMASKLNISTFNEVNGTYENPNLHNTQTDTLGYELMGNGTLQVNTNAFVTDYIEVDYTKTMYAIGGNAITVLILYNESKSMITTLVLNWNNDIPQVVNLSSYTTCKYIRFSCAISKRYQVILSYEKLNYPYQNNCYDFTKIYGLSNFNINHWMGKIGDSLGDSITGQGYFQKYTWDLLNLYAFYNHGIGGSKVTSSDANAMHQDVRINALNENADFITIMGGTNDGAVSIGDISLSNIDTSTYAGALNVIISKLYYKYAHKSISNGVDYSGIVQTTNAKNIKIFLMTPTFVASDTSTRLVNQSECIRELSKLWGLPYVDISGKSGMNLGTIDYCFGSSDLIHPIENCHRDMIAPVITQTLIENPIIDYDKVMRSKLV